MDTVEKIYKTPECTRRAIKKYIQKNATTINAKNLELYHKNNYASHETAKYPQLLIS